MAELMEHFRPGTEQQYHIQRCRDILAKHPEVKKLMVREPKTFVITLFILIAQTSIAWAMGSLGTAYWWVALLVAFCIGAFMNHNMYVIIHEATHNLVFKSRAANRLVLLLADLPNIIPGAIGFKTYHLKHHSHLADYDYDADMANHWEARLVKNIWWRKAIWLALFPFIQALRPPRLKEIQLWSPWLFVNIGLNLAFGFGLFYFFGANALIYMLMSLFFAIGLHPVGARWISEHYSISVDDDQETFSYYGPINRISMNIGYHNEHHDFPSIPWSNLPKLRKMAPEFYDSLKSHSSWTQLLRDFIFDKRYTLYSRLMRPEGSSDISGNKPIRPSMPSIALAD